MSELRELFRAHRITQRRATVAIIVGFVAFWAGFWGQKQGIGWLEHGATVVMMLALFYAFFLMARAAIRMSRKLEDE